MLEKVMSEPLEKQNVSYRVARQAQLRLIGYEYILRGKLIKRLSIGAMWPLPSAALIEPEGGHEIRQAVQVRTLGLCLKGLFQDAV